MEGDIQTRFQTPDAHELCPSAGLSIFGGLSTIPINKRLPQFSEIVPITVLQVQLVGDLQCVVSEGCPVGCAMSDFYGLGQEPAGYWAFWVLAFC